MLDAARFCSLLARPESGIAARLPQVPRSTSPLSADPRLPQVLRSNTSLNTRHSSLHFLIGTAILLETDLTPSAPTPSALLIGTIHPLLRANRSFIRLENRQFYVQELFGVFAEVADQQPQ